ncbi:MAG: CDP-alcohol phosphatidyltransferase family protein [Actinomycetia bacterium]|nr:CDP-alcohol phosphatidyltransferase family protein [Actinomycetes bacterium]
MENIRQFFATQLRRAFTPMLAALRRLRITPNEVTIAGTILNMVAAALVVADHLIYAGIVFLVAGCFDMLDGALARMAQKVTRFGAFLDSTLDRVSEGVVLAAIAYLLAAEGHAIDAALVVLALMGAMLVSYTRARAESLGVECKVGIMSRPERVILIALGLFFDVLPYVIYIMLALTVVTVIQRVVHTYRQLGRQEQ